jgi:hypothetical protein
VIGSTVWAVGTVATENELKPYATEGAVEMLRR